MKLTENTSKTVKITRGSQAPDTDHDPNPKFQNPDPVRNLDPGILPPRFYILM